MSDKIQDNEILADCSWFADKHRGKNKQSGPYWSTIIRFTPLFDEAVRLQQRVDTLEAYIDEFTPDSMQIAQLKAENERIREALEEIANSAGIDGCGFTSGEGHANCVWKARKALKEVTK